MNQCIYIGKESECYNYKDTVNSKGKCLWHTYGILSDPICQHKYNGMAVDTIKKIEEKLKADRHSENYR